MNSGIISALMIGAAVIGTTAGAQANSHTGAPIAAVESGAPAVSAGRVAHTDSTRTTDSTRAYDAQALRIESSWGSAKVIRGAPGEILGTVGWFRDYDVEKLVEASPRALADAHKFRANNFRGSVLTAIGATTAVVGIVLTANSSNNAASPMVIIAGAGIMAYGAQHINKGYNALSRAVWWYNRDLVK